MNSLRLQPLFLLSHSQIHKYTHTHTLLCKRGFQIRHLTALWHQSLCTRADTWSLSPCQRGQRVGSDAWKSWENLYQLHPAQHTIIDRLLEVQDRQQRIDFSALSCPYEFCPIPLQAQICTNVKGTDSTLLIAVDSCMLK